MDANQMTQSLITYSQLLRQSYRAREEGDFELEDELLSRLDHEWLAMSAQEREASKSVARATRAHYKMEQTLANSWQSTLFRSFAQQPAALSGSFDFKVGKKFKLMTSAPLNVVEPGWNHQQAAAA